MGQRHVVVAGNGMVGQRFVDRLVAGDADRAYRITVVGEECRPAYDRVALSTWFEGRTEADLRLVAPDFVASVRVDYRLGVRVASIRPDERTVTLADGALRFAYADDYLAGGGPPLSRSLPLTGERAGWLERELG